MLSPGAEVGKYVVEAHLGSGGLGDVYRVRHQVLGTHFALKVLKADHLKERVLRERFLEEGRLMAACKHPNLVRISDVLDLSDPPLAGLVMEYLEGPSLASRIAEGPVPEQEAIRWVDRLLEALGTLHERGVVHRDVKPDNLVFDRWGELRLLDFGIAKSPDADHTAEDQTLGTPGYMAPEQWGSARDVGPGADLFAVGVLLQELLTGTEVFAGETSLEVLENVRAGNARSLTEEDPELARYAPVVDQALAVDPEDRFATADAFRDALSEVAPGPEAGPPSYVAEASSDPPDGIADVPTPPEREQPLYVMYEDTDDDKVLGDPTSALVQTDGDESRRSPEKRTGWRGVFFLFFLGLFLFAVVVVGLFVAMEGVPWGEEVSKEQGGAEPAPVVDLPFSAEAGERLAPLHGDVIRRCASQVSAGITGRATVIGQLTAKGRIVSPEVTLVSRMSVDTSALRACISRALTSARPGNPEGRTVQYTVTVPF